MANRCWSAIIFSSIDCSCFLVFFINYFIILLLLLCFYKIVFRILLCKVQEPGCIVKHMPVPLPDKAYLDIDRIFQRNSPDFRYGLRNIPEHKTRGDFIGYEFLDGIKLAGIMQDSGPESFPFKPFLDDLILVETVVKHNQRLILDLLNGDLATPGQRMIPGHTEYCFRLRQLQNIVGILSQIIDWNNCEIQNTVVQHLHQIPASSLSGIKHDFRIIFFEFFIHLRKQECAYHRRYS